MKIKKFSFVLILALMATSVLYIANEVIYVYRTNKMNEKLDLIKMSMTQAQVIDILGNPTDERWTDAKKLKEDVIMNQKELDEIINTHKVLLQYSYCISRRKPPLFLKKACTTCVTIYFDNETKKVILVSGYNFIWR